MSDVSGLVNHERHSNFRAPNAHWLHHGCSPGLLVSLPIRGLNVFYLSGDLLWGIRERRRTKISVTGLRTQLGQCRTVDLN